MKRHHKTNILIIQPEVIEPEEIPATPTEIPTIRLQRVPNLTNAIAFALLAIRTAKINGTKLNVEINLTNIYCFDVPDKTKEIDKVKSVLKGLL